MEPRTLTKLDRLGNINFTIMRDDRHLESSWSNPKVPYLVFADHQLPAARATSHGGPIGSGLPVQLVFWGSWWRETTEGAARSNFIIDRTQALIASDYFSELSQYGVAKPFWRDSLIVAEPVPPMVFNSNDDAQAVRDLIDTLIDNDVFPDPDDERIAFVVLMPSGFTTTIANGAHTFDYNYTFPFDFDYYWVAWVRFFSPPADNPEDTMKTLSHELAELFTDPEGTTWYAGPKPDGGEISDAGVSGNTKQAAWVNGVRVQSYWSNRDSATIIPIDRDYRARIRGTISVTRNSTLDSGTFHPDPSDSDFCPIVPQCCIKDRPYSWSLTGREERLDLRLETYRYRQPKPTWTIDGKTVSGVGSIKVKVMAQTYSGRQVVFAPATVTLDYAASNYGITMRSKNTRANFDVSVGCRVADASIDGKVKVDVVATPVVTVGWVGVQLTVDPEYLQQRSACEDAVAELFSKTPQKSHEPRPGQEVELRPDLIAELPAYARVTQYHEARRAIALVRMATELLPPDRAADYAKSLTDRNPILAAPGAAKDTRKGGPSLA